MVLVSACRIKSKTVKSQSSKVIYKHYDVLPFQSAGEMFCQITPIFHNLSNIICSYFCPIIIHTWPNIKFTKRKVLQMRITIEYSSLNKNIQRTLIYLDLNKWVICPSTVHMYLHLMYFSLKWHILFDMSKYFLFKTFWNSQSSYKQYIYCIGKR